MDSQGNPENAEEVEKVRDEIRREMAGEEPATVVDPAVAVEQGHDEPAKQDDPFSGVDPAIKAMFDTLSSKVDAISQAVPSSVEERLKQAERRIGSITQEVKAAQAAAQDVKTAPTQEQIAAAAKTDEQWTSLKKDFPEWAEAIDGRLASSVAAISEELKALKARLGSGSAGDEEMRGQITTLQEQLSSSVPEQVQRGLVSFFHPGWEEKVKAADFIAWAKQQPPEIQKLSSSPLAGDAVRMLDLFEESKGTTKTAEEIAAERRRRLQSGVVVQGGKAPKPAASESELSGAALRSKIGKELWGSA